jgi:hypothetical protein
MLVDYVRIYREFKHKDVGSVPLLSHAILFSLAEDPARHNIGCDPEDYPTAAYIERYKEAYNNPNIVSIGFDVL